MTEQDCREEIKRLESLQRSYTLEANCRPGADEFSQLQEALAAQAAEREKE